MIIKPKYDLGYYPATIEENICECFYLIASVLYF